MKKEEEGGRIWSRFKFSYYLFNMHLHQHTKLSNLTIKEEGEVEFGCNPNYFIISQNSLFFIQANVLLLQFVQFLEFEII